MDDAALIVRLRAGDEAAFGLLVRDHGPWLQRLAAELVHSEAVAEEVVQDTWLAVYLGIDRFEGKSSLRTWITHILQNRARSARSREQRCTAVCGEDLDRLADTTSLWTTRPTSCTDDVDARVTAHQLARTVRRVLPRLPAAQRDVVVLRDVEHVPAAEVTERLGVSNANQRVLLHRAHTSLRRHLAAQLP